LPDVFFLEVHGGAAQPGVFFVLAESVRAFAERERPFFVADFLDFSL